MTTNTAIRKPALALLAGFWLAAAVFAQSPPKPNIVLIFTDDQGYADVGVYGSPNIRTPHIDRMAAEGIRFTDFYAQTFCGPSRGALMTGCYPPRVSLAFNHMPKAETGINPDEITIAELLKQQGYATMIVGKWHLGDHPRFLPNRHGFDHYFGLPYSNDMWPYNVRTPLHGNEHPRLTAARRRAAKTGHWRQGTYLAAPYPDLPLMRDEEVLEFNLDQRELTSLYTEEALKFIAENKDRPFFLYLAHAMPHVPLFASEKFEGKSKRGLYGDVIEEVDWSVGRILAELKELNLDEKTLVIFTSDNGPWLPWGIDAGSAGPLRSGKGTVYEGGMRVPGIMRWPGRIPEGAVTSEVAATIDLYPTFARLAGAALPSDRVIDGADIWPLMSQAPEASSPHEAFYYYAGGGRRSPVALRAIRRGEWKLHFTSEGQQLRGKELYNLGADVGESRNLLARHPDIVRELETTAQAFNDELRRNVRPLGTLDDAGTAPTAEAPNGDNK